MNIMPCCMTQNVPGTARYGAQAICSNCTAILDPQVKLMLTLISPPHWCVPTTALRWRHNGPDSVSNHQHRDCLLNRLFRHRSKKTSKLRVTGLCAGNSPEAGEFPAQMASNAENVSIWWRHHGVIRFTVEVRNETNLFIAYRGTG